MQSGSVPVFSNHSTQVRLDQIHLNPQISALINALDVDMSTEFEKNLYRKPTDQPSESVELNLKSSDQSTESSLSYPSLNISPAQNLYKSELEQLNMEFSTLLDEIDDLEKDIGSIQKTYTQMNKKTTLFHSQVQNITLKRSQLFQQARQLQKKMISLSIDDLPEKLKSPAQVSPKLLVEYAQRLSMSISDLESNANNQFDTSKTTMSMSQMIQLFSRAVHQLCHRMLHTLNSAQAKAFKSVETLTVSHLTSSASPIFQCFDSVSNSYGPQLLEWASKHSMVDNLVSDMIYKAAIHRKELLVSAKFGELVEKETQVDPNDKRFLFKKAQKLFFLFSNSILLETACFCQVFAQDGIFSPQLFKKTKSFVSETLWSFCTHLIPLVIKSTSLDDISSMVSLFKTKSTHDGAEQEQKQLALFNFHQSVWNNLIQKVVVEAQERIIFLCQQLTQKIKSLDPPHEISYPVCAGTFHPCIEWIEWINAMITPALPPSTVCMIVQASLIASLEALYRSSKVLSPKHAILWLLQHMSKYQTIVDQLPQDDSSSASASILWGGEIIATPMENSMVANPKIWGHKSLSFFSPKKYRISSSSKASSSLSNSQKIQNPFLEPTQLISYRETDTSELNSSLLSPIVPDHHQALSISIHKVNAQNILTTHKIRLQNQLGQTVVLQIMKPLLEFINLYIDYANSNPQRSPFHKIKSLNEVSDIYKLFSSKLTDNCQNWIRLISEFFSTNQALEIFSTCLDPCLEIHRVFDRIVNNHGVVKSLLPQYVSQPILETIPALVADYDDLTFNLLTETEISKEFSPDLIYNVKT